jgi:hypothetical protein
VLDCWNCRVGSGGGPDLQPLKRQYRGLRLGRRRDPRERTSRAATRGGQAPQSRDQARSRAAGGLDRHRRTGSRRRATRTRMPPPARGRSAGFQLGPPQRRSGHRMDQCDDHACASVVGMRFRHDAAGLRADPPAWFAGAFLREWEAPWAGRFVSVTASTLPNILVSSFTSFTGCVCAGQLVFADIQWQSPRRTDGSELPPVSLDSYLSERRPG